MPFARTAASGEIGLSSSPRTVTPVRPSPNESSSDPIAEYSRSRLKMGNSTPSYPISFNLPQTCRTSSVTSPDQSNRFIPYFIAFRISSRRVFEWFFSLNDERQAESAFTKFHFVSDCTDASNKASRRDSTNFSASGSHPIKESGKASSPTRFIT